jgi:hypothetical protein
MNVRSMALQLAGKTFDLHMSPHLYHDTEHSHLPDDMLRGISKRLRFLSQTCMEMMNIDHIQKEFASARSFAPVVVAAAVNPLVRGAALRHQQAAKRLSLRRSSRKKGRLECRLD